MPQMLRLQFRNGVSSGDLHQTVQLSEEILKRMTSLLATLT
jgi:hypothetical protein